MKFLAYGDAVNHSRLIIFVGDNPCPAVFHISFHEDYRQYFLGVIQWTYDFLSQFNFLLINISNFCLV